MLYCFNGHEFKDHKQANNDIKYAKSKNVFIYYDEQEDTFKDTNDNIVNVEGQMVIPSSFVFQLPKMIEALEKAKAIIPNTNEDIKKVEEWYKYVETQRLIMPFTGSDVKDPEFLNFIIEMFKDKMSVFLKTRNKDFNGIIDIEDLVNEDSDLRKAFAYHEDEEFIISERVEINEDELGQEEYRFLVFNGQILNVSRITDTTYHKIPIEAIEYANRVIESLPKSFPRTFTLDIFSYQNMYDIIEFNPLEASGRYLYNSIFTASDDLTHEDIECIPEERDKEEVSYEVTKDLKASTLKKVQGTFAQDYDDIKRYGKRVEGFVHIHGLPEGVKINIDELFANMTLLEEENEFHDLDQSYKKSLTNDN